MSNELLFIRKKNVMNYFFSKVTENYWFKNGENQILNFTFLISLPAIYSWESVHIHQFFTSSVILLHLFRSCVSSFHIYIFNLFMSDLSICFRLLLLLPTPNLIAIEWQAVKWYSTWNASTLTHFQSVSQFIINVMVVTVTRISLTLFCRFHKYFA